MRTLFKEALKGGIQLTHITMNLVDFIPYAC